MTLLISTERKNNDTLSGESIPFDFDLWLKEFEIEGVKRTTNSFVDIIENIFLFLRSKNCKVVNEERVSDFLEKHAGVINYLYEAPNIIQGKFGQIGLNLELSFDPEIKDDEGELFLNIETDFDARKAHEKLNEIDKEWLIPVVGESVAKFNLNLDFI